MLFYIKDAHISDGRFATKIGTFVWMVGEFGELQPGMTWTANRQPVHF